MDKIIASLMLCTVFMMGCDRPSHTVIENGNLVIYKALERENKNLGKYEYWIRDNSVKGWVLITDKSYNEGDVVEITVKSVTKP